MAVQELQGLLQLSRLILKVTRPLKTKIDRVILAGDSACSIMALKRDGLTFNAYFQNRLAEIQHNLKEIEEKVSELEPLRKIDGPLNPADICTWDKGKLCHLLPGGQWQKGPPFLTEPRSSWPLTDVDDSKVIPIEEIRKLNSVDIRKEYFGPPDTSLTEWIQKLFKRSLNLRLIKSVLI